MLKLFDTCIYSGSPHIRFSSVRYGRRVVGTLSFPSLSNWQIVDDLDLLYLGRARVNGVSVRSTDSYCLTSYHCKFVGWGEAMLAQPGALDTGSKIKILILYLIFLSLIFHRGWPDPDTPLLQSG